jgi:hypothetical protein
MKPTGLAANSGFPTLIVPTSSSLHTEVGAASFFSYLIHSNSNY